VIDPEEFAKLLHDCREEEKRAVNAGATELKPGIEWTLWRWEQVSEMGRKFETAVAKRAIKKLGL
jgi:hypothetical protein